MTVVAPAATREAVRPATLDLVRATRGRRRRREQTVGAVLGVLVVAAFLTSVLLGPTYTVSFADFVRILGGAQIPAATFIVMDDRLPAAVIGALVGAAFALSGAVFQTMLRNPLASPDVVGVTSGASAAAVFAVIVLGAGGATVSAAALLGALAVGVVMHAVARGSGAGSGGLHGHRLVLVGIGVAAGAQAVVSFLLARSDVRLASDALVWLSGSLANSTWERVAQLLVGLGVLLPLLAVLARRLRPLELGPDLAAGLGVRGEPTRLGLLLVAVGLAAVATAAAGPVAFVAFLSAPVARRLVRGPAPLPVVALTGALLVLGADLLAGRVVPGATLPVGIVTGAIGAPFLLVLLVGGDRLDRRGRRGGTGS